MKKPLAIGGLAVGLTLGGVVGLLIGHGGSSSAQSTTTEAPSAPANGNSLTPGLDQSNSDPAHETAEDPQREAEETAGRGFEGHHGFGGDHGFGGRSNHDAAHEASESPERAAEEATRDAAAPTDSTPAPKAA